MAFLIGGANTLATGDLITNSLRFGVVADDSHLEFTPSSGSGATTFTISCWVKKAKNPESGTLLGGRNDDNALKFLGGGGTNDSKIQFIEYAGGSDDAYYIRTNRRFRDPSAWMHVVLIYDATNGTAGDRMRLYINGTRETSFSHEVQLPQNRVHHGFFHNNVAIRIGREVTTSGGPSSSFNGYIADVYCSDGTAYEPTEFAETNDNGVWVPKEADVSFGTNGFRLEFKETGTSANASGIGAETCGNGNHFSVNALAATDVTTDTPTNNFATGNPLILIAGGNITPSFSEGNTKWTSGANSSYGTSGHGNIAVTNGKWYWEMKIDAGRNNGVTCGIAPVSVFENHYGTSTSTDYTFARDNLGSFGYQHTNSGSKKVTGTAAENADDYGSPGWSVDDIIGVAMDLDNDTLTFYLNGTSQGQAFSSLPDVYYTPAWYGYSSTVWEFNSGNPYNAISSGNSDGNGYGNFEYAVPSGFYSLCTKNLAEYG